MDQKAMKLKQEVHEKGRKQLSLGRRAQELTDPAEREALLREQTVLGREIAALKRTIARMENA